MLGRPADRVPDGRTGSGCRPPDGDAGGREGVLEPSELSVRPSQDGDLAGADQVRIGLHHEPGDARGLVLLVVGVELDDRRPVGPGGDQPGRLGGDLQHVYAGPHHLG